MKFNTQIGFTLIELLVAIAILAIISTIGFASYSQAQLLARDAKRKQDLRSISTALQLYYNSHSPKTFPITAATACCGSDTRVSTSANWISELDTNFINKLPRDPKNNDALPTVANQYGYAYWAGPTGPGTLYLGNCPPASSGGQYFILVARLENTSDQDRNEVQHYKYCDNTTEISTAVSTSADYKYLYVVASQ